MARRRDRRETRTVPEFHSSSNPGGEKGIPAVFPLNENFNSLQILSSRWRRSSASFREHELFCSYCENNATI